MIAVEMQGHGRAADIKRDLSYENLADDVAGVLRFLKIPRDRWFNSGPMVEVVPNQSKN